MRRYSIGQVTTIVALITGVGAAVATVDKYRWWPWLTELQLVAGVSFKTAITINFDKLLTVQSFIFECERESDRCDRERLLDLKKQEQRLKEEIEELERQQEEIGE